MNTEKIQSTDSGAEKSQADSIVKWIDGLAKGVVVITALLYIVGRSYTESYYTHLGIPTSNLPLTLQEYLFMSTKSLSFLKNAISAFLISVISAPLLQVAAGILPILFKSLTGFLSKKSKNENKARIETSKNKRKTEQAVNKKDTALGYRSNYTSWFKDKLIFIIPIFIMLVFFMLLPSAKTSGRIDAENAIQQAPLGRILLNQPSIPELTPQIYSTQKDVILYGYGLLPIIGTLGDDYLIVLENEKSNKAILSVPKSEVVSINYVNYVSLTPMPTETVTPDLAAP